MKVKKDARKGVVAAILCMSIIAVRPATAFIWPTIDAAQIGAFATSLQDGVAQVNNVNSQIQNTTTTINTVGDQATSALKYTSDLQGSLTKFLPENLSGISVDVGSSEIIRTTQITANVEIETSKGVADNTVDGVEVLIDDDASEEDVQQLIEDAKQETEESKNKINNTFEEADKSVINFSDKARASVDQLIEIINKNQDLETSEREEYIAEAESIRKQINSFQSNALDIIQNAKEQFASQYNKNVLAAYEAYSAAISDYYENKITREELNQAGEKLKQSIAQTEAGLDAEVINRLIQTSEQIAENVELLKEKIIDSLSNSREYPEDEFEKTSWVQEKNMQKMTFSYHSQKKFVQAKSVYETDSTNRKFFIMPEELAKCKVGGKIDTNKLEKLQEDDTISTIRKNVVCTRMEKTFWCPDDPDDKSCRPYKQAGWKKYEKNGTYHHMLEDYLAASIVTQDKAKQLVNTWARGDKSVYKKYNNMLRDAGTDTRKMYQILGLINLEATKLWSWVRRNDAMDRGKSIIERLGQADELYLGIKNGEDEADELVQNALKKQLGTMKVKTGEESVDALVFSNVFLYACEDVKAEDVSVDSEHKYDKNELKEKEKQISSCLFKFAEAANRGTVNGEEVIPGNKEMGAKRWRKYVAAIMQDTAFQTLYLSMLSSHKSVKDLAKKSNNSSDATILSLQKGLKDATVARDDYTAGAEINYYATEQILDILDAEAQSIQTEILQDLPKLNYNTFAETVGENGGQNEK